jgi:hypothetical protein
MVRAHINSVLKDSVRIAVPRLLHDKTGHENRKDKPGTDDGIDEQGHGGAPAGS